LKELKVAVLSVWGEIEKEMCEKLVLSFRKRAELVIRDGGAY
jgi:hypothetical protein